MTRRRKRTITLLLLTVMLLAFGITASAGFQKMPGGRYRYYVTKNSYLKGQKNGEVRIPALKNLTYKGKKYTYAFDENGYMLTGWQVLYTRDQNGESSLGCYYFNKNGQMMKNTQKNGHYFLGNGRMVNDYDKYGHYYGMDGRQTTPPKSAAGWVKSKKGMRYQITWENYAAKTWMCIRDPKTKKAYWYYFKRNGYMAKKTWVGTHYVDKNGRWSPGKKKIK